MGNLSSIFSNDDTLTSDFPCESSPFESDIFTKSQSLRNQARQYQLEAKETSGQSQVAYHSGRKAEAKLLSIKKADLYQKMNEKNQEAAKLIFGHFNRNRPSNVIDLHGLYVSEALNYLQEKLDECHSADIKELKVITGMGNNSPNKIAKIKPEVEKFARKNNLLITPYPGHVMIKLGAYDPYAMSINQNTNGCIIL